MHISVQPAATEDVAPLRELHRFEMHCQIVHDSFLGRALSDPYLLSIDGRTAGYGLVANKYNRGAVDEFYVTPAYRGDALPLFRELVGVSGATGVRAQTNDPLLLQMLYDNARAIKAEAILFADAVTTSLTCDGAFYKLTEADKNRLFPKGTEQIDDYAIELDGAIVATGGVLFHYNPPYSDVFMQVEEQYRRRGFGSYIVQELKRVSYEIGKIPAARCNADNVASRRTLQKAGFLPCGRILTGKIAK